MPALLLALLGCSDYELIAPPLDVEAPLCDLVDPDPYEAEVFDECRGEPQIGSFTPVVEWNWNTNPVHAGYQQIMMTPVVGNLTDDNGDGVVDDDDTPDIVFTAFSGNAYTSPGALVAISGHDGSTLWSVTSSEGHQPYGTGGVAIADLHGTGDPTVLVAAAGGLLAVDGAGRHRWFAAVPEHKYAHPAIGDVDGDGSAEIAFGPSVVDASGNLRWTGELGAGGYAWMSFFADVDSDGLQELVAGRTLYAHDGTVLWDDGGPEGFPAIADLDLDGSPEIVRVGGGVLRAVRADGTLMWDQVWDDGSGGPPTIADYDGDGAPEIGIAGKQFYRVFEADGTEKWRREVKDYSSNITGSSVFDFEGDGAAEVVYADEETLWVFDGATGAVEMAWESHSSGTLFEYPLVVDVDRDGVTEIVVASNDYAFTGSRGITVIGDADGSWAPARPVWNQHAYAITNVNDDNSVPAVQKPSWKIWNSFRAGNSMTAVGLGLPNLAVGMPQVCTTECGTGIVEAWFPIENGGPATTGPLDVAIYGSRGETEVLLGVFPVPQVGRGSVAWVGPFRIDHETFGKGLRIVVDDDGSGQGDVTECDEIDNERTWVDFPCDVPE